MEPRIFYFFLMFLFIHSRVLFEVYVDFGIRRAITENILGWAISSTPHVNGAVVLADWGFALNMPLSIDEFAGTAMFMAKEYAQNWIIDESIQYQARYDCESLLKCFYIMIQPELRLKFKNNQNHLQKLQSAINTWEEIADHDPKFKSYLIQIAQGTANPYQVLKDFVNSYLENGTEFDDADIGDDIIDDEMMAYYARYSLSNQCLY